MKVLVLGGTGAMGSHLVRLLVESGVEVSVSSRAREGMDGGVHYLRGNALELGFLNKLLRSRWDVIVDFMIYSTPRFKERVESFLGATDQYIFLSSARVYANSSDQLTENSPRLLDSIEDEDYLATDEYALAKARQEDLLLTSGRRNWTVVRPYITYSESRLQLGVLEKEEWLYRALNGRAIVFSEEIAASVTTLTYGEDVAKGILSLIGSSDAKEEIFHITANESIRWRNVLDIYLTVFERVVGHKPRVIFASAEDFLRCHPEQYQIQYDRLFHRTFSNAKIKRKIEVADFTGLEMGVTKCLEEFLKAPQFLQINWRREAVKDRLTKEWTSLGEIEGVKQKAKYVKFRLFK